MEILRKELAQYDKANQGSISTDEFRSVLNKFGVGHGLNIVVKKFGRDNKIDYGEFLHYFENSKKMKYN
jgi:Ca2+-binding EF-hand superfamily protein